MSEHLHKRILDRVYRHFRQCLSGSKKANVLDSMIIVHIDALHSCMYIYIYMHVCHYIRNTQLLESYTAYMKAMIAISELADWRLPDDEFLKYFELPRGAERCTELMNQNPISTREARIVFEPSSHTYKIDGICAPRSVTGLVHSYSGNSFDAHKAVVAMKAGRHWEERRRNFLQEDGSEMNDAVIVNMWKERGQVARTRGILFHYHCEAHCNGLLVESPHSPEFQMFLVLMEALDQMGFTPFRTEVCIFHIGLCVAGQLDALFRNHMSNTFALIDWKRCRTVIFDDSFRTLWPPLDHLPECNGSLYALQLNMYRYILESEYGFYIGENMYLGVCHPESQTPSLIRVPLLQVEIDIIIRDQIARGYAMSAAEPELNTPFRLPGHS